MSEVREINEAPITRLDRDPGASERSRETQPEVVVRRGDDRVEVSDMARLLHRLRAGEVRGELVDRVRSEVEAGVYETPERLDGTIDVVLDELSQHE